MMVYGVLSFLDDLKVERFWGSDFHHVAKAEQPSGEILDSVIGEFDPQEVQ